jgi:hypothetical protein
MEQGIRRTLAMDESLIIFIPSAKAREEILDDMQIT